MVPAGRTILTDGFGSGSRMAALNGTPSRTGISGTRTVVAQAAAVLGRPFVYVWYYAADQLGRAIAGDSWIVYTVDDMTWAMRSDTPA